jgi:hypothetical protein
LLQPCTITIFSCIDLGEPSIESLVFEKSSVTVWSVSRWSGVKYAVGCSTLQRFVFLDRSAFHRRHPVRFIDGSPFNRSFTDTAFNRFAFVQQARP